MESNKKSMSWVRASCLIIYALLTLSSAVCSLFLLIANSLIPEIDLLLVGVCLFLIKSALDALEELKEDM